MTPSVRPLCDICEFLVSGMDPENTSGRPVCSAFPDGIPDDVSFGGFDHRVQLRDEPVTFELASNLAASDLDAWERERVEFERSKYLSLIDVLEAGRFV